MPFASEFAASGSSISHDAAGIQGANAESTAVAPTRRLSSDRIIVATDGQRDSDGAVRVGIALSQRDHSDVALLSVVEPTADFDAGGILATDTAMLTSSMRELRVSELRAQRDRTYPAASDWPLTIELGNRVAAIVGDAEKLPARCIVLGLGVHGPGARLRARETAIRVIRAATVPVLAVPAHAWGVPHSALAGLDFTPSSESAARAALELLGGEGTLYLAHVATRLPIPQGDSRDWEEITTRGGREPLEAVAQRLRVPPGVRVEYVMLHGEPAHELLAFAEQFRIDLIAAGIHARSRVHRLLMGSVSTKLVRNAHCWVLIAPSGDPASPAGQ